MDPNLTMRLYAEAMARARALCDGEAIAACDAFLEADGHMQTLIAHMTINDDAPKWEQFV